MWVLVTPSDFGRMEKVNKKRGSKLIQGKKSVKKNVFFFLLKNETFLLSRKWLSSFEKWL
jgi:hypothetical protein